MGDEPLSYPEDHQEKYRMNIRHIIRDIARQNCWQVNITEQYCPHLLSASIDLNNWQLFFNISPLSEIKLNQLDISAPEQELLAKGLIAHEMNH